MGHNTYTFASFIATPETALVSDTFDMVSIPDTIPSAVLPETRRYTDQDIRRNRLKTVIVGGALLVAAAFGYESITTDASTPTVAAAVVDYAAETAATPQATVVPELPTTTTTAETPTLVIAQSQTESVFTETTTLSGTRANNQRLAHQIAREEYSLSNTEIQCMDNVVMGTEEVVGESQYNTAADNPHSTAYGIAQAMLSLHGEQIRADYPDYYEGTIQNPRGGNPRTQIRWMIDYMKDRYGSVCKAWAFKRINETY